MTYQRALLKDAEAYTPGEQPQGPGVVKLNTNENPYPPSPKALEALRALDGDALRRYPDPLSAALRRACAERYGFPDESWMIAGNGMDELLAMAIRTFCDPGDEILTPYPTYSLYETLAALHGAQVVTVDLDDAWQLPEAFLDFGGRLCFVPRPNAPTGLCAPKDRIARLCEAFPGVVVVDEAYVDFAEDHCMDLPHRYENVIVMRTFSKSFSMAGMRLGVAAACPALIAELLKTKDSYNLNAATQAAGLAAMQDYDWMLENATRVKRTRGRLTESLRDLGFDVLESQANFVLAFAPADRAAADIFEALKSRSIFVRYFNKRRLDNALRISIGTEEETDALLGALKEILA